MLQLRLTTADRVRDVETLDKGFTSHLASLLLYMIFTDLFLTLSVHSQSSGVVRRSCLSRFTALNFITFTWFNGYPLLAMERGARPLGWSHLGMVLFLRIVFILLKRKGKKILNFESFGF